MSDLNISKFSSVTVVNFTSDDKYYKIGYNQLERYYLSWYLPLTILVGLFGNIACLIFMTISKLFPRNVLIWMICISIGDLMILGFDSTRMLIKVWFQFDIRDVNSFCCKLHTFLSNYFFYWSSYMQACMSVQRLIFMLRPLKARSMFTTQRVLSICGVVTLLLIFPVIPYLIYWHIGHARNDCEPVDDSLYGIITILDVVIWGFIPLLTMTISTFGISWSVFKASSERNSMLHQSNNLLDRDSSVKGKTNKNQTTNGRPSYQTNDDAWHVTKLLISMNLLYLFSAYPLLIYQTYLNSGGNKVNRTIPQQLHKTIYYSLRSICYVSSSWNWVFYCMGGRKFRDKAKQIVRQNICCLTSNKYNNSQMGNDTQIKLVTTTHVT